MIVGVLGGGQLGRMLALAGYPLGLEFKFLDPDRGCPAAKVGELVVGGYEDESALAKFVRGVDVVTYEFENVPAGAAIWLTEHVSVFPPRGALETAQDRISEKTLFRELGIGTAEFAPVDTREQLDAAINRVGTPCVLKTRRLGYDGKGQSVVRAVGEVDGAWSEVCGASAADGPAGLILESFVPFTRELSIIGVRARDGASRFYPPIQNVHERGILSRSTAPAPGVSDAQRLRMEEATARTMDAMGYVGVLAVEYFDLGGGRFVANEMAPRVHNSGHWTIEGARTSQFENHLRAICAMPLGETEARGASAMLNIIGGEPDMDGLLQTPGAHVHMYGKAARPGRKLGHVTLCESDLRRVNEAADGAMRALRNG